MKAQSDKDYAQDLSTQLTNAMNSWKGNDTTAADSKRYKSESRQSKILDKPVASQQDVVVQKIRLHSTRAGKGGKTVTCIKGFESAPQGMKLEILKSIKQRISVGGRIDDNGTLEIQGDQVLFLLDYFSKAGYKDVKKG